MDAQQYSFCESATATATSPWCIRPLTDVGQKLSGGVDTPSLCGRVRKGWGWDVRVPFSEKHQSACPECLKILLTPPAPE